jgi:ADP-ribose pyrophosphatase YjhB (NUDIX family)
VRRIGIRLAALAQDGLAYADDDYDLDRYRQVSGLAAELLSVLSGRPAEELAVELGRDSGYATPKIDVRGVIFDDDERVLLMREKTDGRWSLPGGWADPGDAPSAAVTREILEETGYHASAVKLIACWDRELQANPPPLPVHVYKLFFLCRRDGAVQPPSALETLDVGWFYIHALPSLSLGRVNHRQLERALAHRRDLLCPVSSTSADAGGISTPTPPKSPCLRPLRMSGDQDESIHQAAPIRLSEVFANCLRERG